MVCGVLYCLAWIHNRGALLRPYIPYYNRAAVLGCTASGRDAGIWYVLEVLRRCDTLQRGAGGIIAAFAGLVSWRWNWANLRKSPCKALCAILCCWLYIKIALMAEKPL